jgi:hypothetical protein
LKYIAPARAEPYLHHVLGAWALSLVTLATQRLTAFYVAFACAIIGGQSALWMELARTKLDGAADANKR